MMKTASLPQILIVALLVTGTTVGAGMLGLPIKTGLSGMVPSLISMVMIWAAMLATSLILAGRMIESRRIEADLPTLFHQEIGPTGKWLCVAGYLIIFYGVLTAYLSGAASILASLIPAPLGKTAWTVIFFIVATGIVTRGLTLVQKGNTAIMMVLGISFLFLLVETASNVVPQRLIYTDWHFAPAALPIIVCAFGFHGIVPTVCRSLNADYRACRLALIVGTLLAFLLNALWVSAVIGALPLTGDGQGNMLAALHSGLPATVPLSIAMHSDVITTAGMFFALAAIITSYMGVGIAFMGFTRDMVSTHFGKSNKYIETGLTFLPPLAVALLYPDLFLRVLDVAGGIGMLLVFGILPFLMVVQSRGKPAGWRTAGAYAMLCIFGILMLLELSQEFGWLHIHPNVEYWHSG